MLIGKKILFKFLSFKQLYPSTSVTGIGNKTVVYDNMIRTVTVALSMSNTQYFITSDNLGRMYVTPSSTPRGTRMASQLFCFQN